MSHYSTGYPFTGHTPRPAALPRPGGADINENIGPMVRFLEVPQPMPITDPKKVMISNVKPVASYNWKEAREPTIVVPGFTSVSACFYSYLVIFFFAGSPLIWAYRELPYGARPDTDIAFINETAARCGKGTNFLEPMFLALNVMAPEYDMSSVDLVTDRSCLRSTPHV